MANKDKLINAAQKFLAKGQVSKAIEEYRKLVSAFPKDIRNRQKLAELLSRNKQNDDAVVEYEHVANNYTETGFYLKAIAVYKQMQKLDPNRVEIYEKLAGLNEKQGLIGNALTEYRNLAAYYEQNNLPEDAASVLEKMLALDKENLNVRAKLTELKFIAEQSEEATSSFLEMIASLQNKREFAKIIKLYERFHEYLPDEVTAKQPLAEALQASGQIEKSIPLFKSLLKSDPENQPILAFLATAYTDVADHENARLTYRHLLKLAPDNLDVREQMVRSSLAVGDTEKALEGLEEAKDAFSQADRIGVLRELYEELNKKQPDDERITQTLTDIYVLCGEEVDLSQGTAESAELPAEEIIDTTVQIDSVADDVETLDVVGESVIPDEISPEQARTLTKDDAVDSALPDLDLDLELDLDLGVSSPAESAEVVEAVEPHPTLETEVEVDEASEEEIAQEVELDLELEGLEGLCLEGLDEDLTAEEPEIAEEIAEELEAAVDFEVEEVAEAPEVAEEVSAEEIAEELEAAVDFEVEEVAEAPEVAEEVSAEEIAEELEAAVDFEVEEVAEAPEVAEEVSAEEIAEELEAAVDFEVEEVAEAPEVAEEVSAEEIAEELEAAVDFEVEEVAETPEVAEEVSAEEIAEELEAAVDFEVEEAAEAPEVAEEVAAQEVAEDLEEHEEVEALEEVVEFEELEELEELEEIEELEELEELEVLEPVYAVDDKAAALSSQLEDAEFYLQQGLFDDAERVLHEAVVLYGEQAELTAKLDEIAVKRDAVVTDDAIDFSDMIAELNDDELLGAADFLGDSLTASDEEGLTQELATELDSSDTESHYNLGIAYKEMGLHDDAIAEFKKASVDSARKIDCLILKAQCFLEMGDLDASEQTLKKGLALDELSQEGRVTLHYELGLFYRAAGRALEALESFQVVADHDLFFRDVTEIVKELRTELGLDDDVDDEAQAGANRDRISFV